jgi:soluble lytic murein transglycosylase
MEMKHKIFVQFVIVICLVLSCSEVPVEVINPTPVKKVLSVELPVVSDEQRQIFLQAEQLLLQGEDDAFLAQMQQLKSHPLYSYLQAKWLKKNLTQQVEIESFLNAYNNNRYAESLRQDWLYFLAKNQRWSRFIKNYQSTTAADTHKIPLQCYFAQAQYSTGQQEQALTLAQELWLKGVSQPACNPIFSAFQQSAHFTEDLVWQRFRSALRGKKANPQLAAQLKQYLSADAQKTADLWLKVYNSPALIVNSAQWDTQNPHAGDIFAQGVDRLAHSQLQNAVGIWESQQNKFTISSETADYVNQQLGVALAAAGYHGYAHARLMKVTTLDDHVNHALIRAALREQNWTHVNEALSKLSATEKTVDRWQYWQARAWAELGKTTEAQQTFAALAKKSNFFALLAADKIQQPYQMQNVPVPVTEEEIAEVQQQTNFRIAAEWFALGRKDEALRQWWYNVKKAEPKQVMAAAKIAQRWQMVKLAAFTIAKAEYWQDLELRFPIAYQQDITHYALKNNLDPALVFGLIRQESVFDEHAGSQVGARGLMQIMPATGRHIAKQLQEPWRSDASLYEADTNIRYGVYYYKQLLDKFRGQAALAAAGYNAGPGRVKQWQPNQTMAMDIWIETIPFNETRHYVSMVLSNALFYQYRMNRDVLKMSDFMADVQPFLGRNQ